MACHSSIPATSKNGLVVKVQTRTLLEVRRRFAGHEKDTEFSGSSESGGESVLIRITPSATKVLQA
jgi:hypothetical protein